MSTPVIISSWLGDNNQTYGLLGLGFVASGAILPTTITIAAGATASFSVALLGNVTLNIDAAAGAGITGGGGVTPGGGGFSIPQGTFTPLFASGLDSATPLAPWNSAFATIVPGRNGNGIQPSIPNDPTGCFAQLATPLYLTAGVAIRFNQDFNQRILQLSSDAASDDSVVNVVLLPIADGRMIMQLRSNAGTDQKVIRAGTGTGPGYVREWNSFAYFELSTAINMTVTPSTPGRSGVAVFGTVTLIVNRFPVWTGSFSTSADLPNALVPSPGASGSVLFRRFSLCSSLGIYDDVYLDTQLYGDVLANPDDLTITSFFTDPSQTQIVQEVMGEQPTNPYFTQVVMEVFGKRQRRFTFASTKAGHSRSAQ